MKEYQFWHFNELFLYFATALCIIPDPLEIQCIYYAILLLQFFLDIVEVRFSATQEIQFSLKSN